MQSRQLQLRHAIVIVAEVPFLFTRKPVTKDNLFPFYPFLKSVLPPYIVVSLWSIRSSPSLSLSLWRHVYARITRESGNEGTGERTNDYDERLKRDTRRPTLPCRSHIIYVRSSRPPRCCLSFLASTHIAPLLLARKRGAPAAPFYYLASVQRQWIKEGRKGRRHGQRSWTEKGV